MTKRGSIGILKQMCEQKDLLFIGVTLMLGHEGYQAFVFDEGLAGIKPVLENMRDQQDYDAEYRNWVRRGTKPIAQHENPTEAIRLAIVSLEE